MPNDEEYETWMHEGRGRWWMNLREGGETITRSVRGGRTFEITRRQRQRLQMETADVASDPFRDGTFRYVGPPELLTDAEHAELAQSPNVKTSDQLVDIATGDDASFRASLAAMTNPVAVNRLLEVSRSRGVPAERLEAIEARAVELHPVKAEEGDPDLEEADEGPPQRLLQAVKGSAGRRGGGSPRVSVGD